MEASTPDGPLGPRPDRLLNKQREAMEFHRALEARTPRVWVTPAIVAVNCIVFALMLFTGVSPTDPTVEDLMRWGADFGFQTFQGEWWRLLTNAFVHIGVVHIGLNMWCLARIGPLCERFYGNGSFLALYVVSALGASFASIAADPGIVSAGASGAVFGVCGGLLAVFLLERKAMPLSILKEIRSSTVAFVVYNVVIGFASSGIDNGAHLGGLAAGFAAGLCFRPSLSGATSARRFWSGAAALAGLLGLAFVPPWIRVHDDPYSRSVGHYDLGVAASQQGDWERATQEFTKSIELDPEYGHTYALRGDAFWNGSDLDAALSDYVRALELDPRDAYAHGQRAWAHQATGDLALAVDGFSDAIELEPENSYFHYSRGWARNQQVQPDAALGDFDQAIQLDPEYAAAYMGRGHGHYNKRSWQEALADLRKAGELDQSFKIFLASYVWVAQMRLESPESAARDLARALEEASADERTQSPARVASYLLGELPERELLLEVEEPDAMEPEQRSLERCTLYYFTGMKSLFDEDLEGARGLLTSAIATGAIDCMAWSSASVELEQLRQ